MHSSKKPRSIILPCSNPFGIPPDESNTKVKKYSQESSITFWATTTDMCNMCVEGVKQETLLVWYYSLLKAHKSPLVIAL